MSVARRQRTTSDRLIKSYRADRLHRLYRCSGSVRATEPGGRASAAKKNANDSQFAWLIRDPSDESAKKSSHETIPGSVGPDGSELQSEMSKTNPTQRLRTSNAQTVKNSRSMTWGQEAGKYGRNESHDTGFARGSLGRGVLLFRSAGSGSRPCAVMRVVRAWRSFALRTRVASSVRGVPTCLRSPC